MANESLQTNMRLPDRAKILLRDLARFRRLSIAKLVVALAEEEALRIRERSSREDSSDPLRALESRIRQEGQELKTESRASRLGRIYGDDMPASFYEVQSEKEIVASFLAKSDVEDQDRGIKATKFSKKSIKNKAASVKKTKARRNASKR